MNQTPTSDRIHIGIFGRRNAGKSSILNALTGQNMAIVSDIKGTTTDPVSKAMELLPLGPVVMIDTPGIDDDGPLGKLRVQKSYQVLNKTDIALLVADVRTGLTVEEKSLLAKISEKKIPYVIAFNKSDLSGKSVVAERQQDILDVRGMSITVSAATGENIHELKELLASLKPHEEKRRIIGDFLKPNDFVVLVVPIDKAAPKGRLILPQQQTIRDILDAKATAIVVQETELADTLRNLGRAPRMVVTDSQVFEKVAAIVPKEIPLTSFSILFARYKGELEAFYEGICAVEQLKDGDQVLICEGCTHHRQCGDIGTQKIPQWMEAHTGKKLVFSFTSGVEFPENLEPYRLIVHCGGCMLNQREMKYRIACAKDSGVPITNYGMIIAYMKGILIWEGIF